MKGGIGAPFGGDSGKVASPALRPQSSGVLVSSSSSAANISGGGVPPGVGGGGGGGTQLEIVSGGGGGGGGGMRVGSPKGFTSSSKAEEERDKRNVAELVAEEKKLLRGIEALQKSEESLRTTVNDMRRGRGRKGALDPLLEAKVEELEIKVRAINDHATSLKRLRDLRAQLESAISEKKISHIMQKSRERVSQAQHRDPSLVLASFREEEARLLEQERALEGALADELEAEEAYEKEGNEAGEWWKGAGWARCACARTRANSQCLVNELPTLRHTHTQTPFFLTLYPPPHTHTHKQLFTPVGMRYDACSAFWTGTGLPCRT